MSPITEGAFERRSEPFNFKGYEVSKQDLFIKDSPEKKFNKFRKLSYQDAKLLKQRNFQREEER
jgi:hypothetical protein